MVYELIPATLVTQSPWKLLLDLLVAGGVSMWLTLKSQTQIRQYLPDIGDTLNNPIIYTIMSIEYTILYVLAIYIAMMIT